MLTVASFLLLAVYTIRNLNDELKPRWRCKRSGHSGLEAEAHWLEGQTSFILCGQSGSFSARDHKVWEALPENSGGPGVVFCSNREFTGCFPLLRGSVFWRALGFFFCFLLPKFPSFQSLWIQDSREQPSFPVLEAISNPMQPILNLFLLVLSMQIRCA